MKILWICRYLRVWKFLKNNFSDSFSNIIGWEPLEFFSISVREISKRYLKFLRDTQNFSISSEIFWEMFRILRKIWKILKTFWEIFPPGQRLRKRFDLLCLLTVRNICLGAFRILPRAVRRTPRYINRLGPSSKPSGWREEKKIGILEVEHTSLCLSNTVHVTGTGCRGVEHLRPRRWMSRGWL